MNSQNQALAVLICKYEETKDKNIVLDIAVKISDMRGLGDPILVQRALEIIDEVVRR
jgi:hypothetical protein